MENRNDMLTPPKSLVIGEIVSRSSREQSSEQRPLTTPRSEAHVTGHSVNGDIRKGALDDPAQYVPDDLTLFSGACFQEHFRSLQYASSVTTNCSLPLPYHELRPDVVPKCHSDNGHHDPDVEQPQYLSRMARSESPAAIVHLWQVQQDDWKTHGSTRSVTQAKRRRKHRVRQSLNKIGALLPGKETIIDEKGDQQE